QVRLGLDQRAAIGEQAAKQGAVALQQLVGELDHARVRPAVLAALEQAQERRFLLAWRVLAHQDRGGRLRARYAGMAMDQNVTARRLVRALAELKHAGDVLHRAGLEAGIL